MDEKSEVFRLEQRERGNEGGLGSDGVSRRALLKSVGLWAAAFVLPPKHGWVWSLPFAAALKNPVSRRPAQNPRWFGFNLLEYFSTDPDWMKYFPYKDDGMFREDDFRWIRDWGFNWVRLPMDYRFWTDSTDLFKIRENKIAPIVRSSLGKSMAYT